MEKRQKRDDFVWGKRRVISYFTIFVAIRGTAVLRNLLIRKAFRFILIRKIRQNFQQRRIDSANAHAADMRREVFIYGRRGVAVYLYAGVWRYLRTDERKLFPRFLYSLLTPCRGAAGTNF